MSNPIDISTPFKVPSEIAVCGYCGAQLWVTEIGECACDEFGVCSDVTTLYLECDTEPEVDAPAWDKWLDTHSNMPYVNELPQEIKVIDWLNSGAVTLVDGSIERRKLEKWMKANR